MARANPTWGAPRIHGELLKLGIDLHQDTVSNYMVKPTRPPSQTWRAFLANHAQDIASIDFFTVPTATFRVLYVFLVLDNARRRILREYIAYYHRDRTHLGLEKDCPEPRKVEPPENGPVKSRAILGGLHHRYYREAA